MPSGLESTRTSPGTAPPFVKMRSGWTRPWTARPKIGSSLRMVWPPDDRAARGPDRLGCGAQHGLDGREREPLGEGRDVQRGRHPAAHGEHVAARVGGGDGAEVGRVVDERREEVGRGHDGDVVADSVDGGVVEGSQADEERVVGRAGQVTNEAGERRATPLGRAATAGRPLREAQRGRVDRVLGGGGLAHGAEPRRTPAPRHRPSRPVRRAAPPRRPPGRHGRARLVAVPSTPPCTWPRSTWPGPARRRGAVSRNGRSGGGP